MYRGAWLILLRVGFRRRRSNFDQRSTLCLVILRASRSRHLESCFGQDVRRTPAARRVIRERDDGPVFRDKWQALFQIADLDAQINWKSPNARHFVGAPDIDDQDLVRLA